MYGYDYKIAYDLEIEDEYEYRNPELVEIMTAKFKVLFPIEDK